MTKAKSKRKTEHETENGATNSKQLWADILALKASGLPCCTRITALWCCTIQAHDSYVAVVAGNGIFMALCKGTPIHRSNWIPWYSNVLSGYSLLAQRRRTA